MALIEFEHTPNPDALRVQNGQMFTNGPALDFDRSNCGDHPLVHALLAIDGIVRVMLGRDFVTVVRSGPDIGWEALRPEIALALLERAIAHPRRRFRPAQTLYGGPALGRGRRCERITGRQETRDLRDWDAFLRFPPSVRVALICPTANLRTQRD
jgi:hypothetical protein